MMETAQFRRTMSEKLVREMSPASHGKEKTNTKRLVELDE